MGKPAAIFSGSGTQGGGMETTCLTTVPVLAHQGMIFVPTGYSFGGKMFDVSTVRGGTAYGAGTFAGADGSRQPSEVELEFAEHQVDYLVVSSNFQGQVLRWCRCQVGACLIN